MLCLACKCCSRQEIAETFSDLFLSTPSRNVLSAFLGQPAIPLLVQCVALRPAVKASPSAPRLAALTAPNRHAGNYRDEGNGRPVLA
jgi:hypothetical protein